MRRSDFVSISCPLTKDNRRMIGARQFALMQPHAFFITTARGFIHDEAALADALRNKRIAGAGLDVWDGVEPPPADHPLLKLPNVVATPHAAGGTRDTQYLSSMTVAKQLLHVMQGNEPFHRVV